ncbi:MAG: metallophosphoesterase [Myxococcales bacterium]|nr:metallophosphoesterase [Myxococcales bacterium]
MRFALITDQHFGPRAHFAGKLRKLSHEAGALTRAFVERMNRVDRPELVVNLGDVVEDESRSLDMERYQEFLGILSALDAPVIHVAGNHDLICMTEDDLARMWNHDGALHYSRDFSGVHFAVLNTLEQKDVCVRLPESQLEWLERDLATVKGPAVVLMHHPASEQDLTGNRWFERAPHICRVAERRELRRIIEASGKVVAVFNGHAHWNHLDVIRGIPYVTLQSLTENLDDDAPGRPAAAFAVCDLEPHRLSVNLGGAEALHYQFELG